MKILNYFYVGFFSLNALALAIAGALNGVEWGNYTPTQKFLAICIITGQFSNTMLALVVVLARRESQGKSLIPTDDTQIITKQQVTVQPNEKTTSS